MRNYAGRENPYLSDGGSVQGQRATASSSTCRDKLTTEESIYLHSANQCRVILTYSGPRVIRKQTKDNLYPARTEILPAEARTSADHHCNITRYVQHNLQSRLLTIVSVNSGVARKNLGREGMHRLPKAACSRMGACPPAGNFEILGALRCILRPPSVLRCYC